jgi:hypothetical protein
MCVDEPAVNQNVCPPGYTFHSSLRFCYKYMGTPTDGIAASINCVNSGGTLIAASTLERNHFIFNTIGSGNLGWIGLAMTLTNGQFEW